MRRRLRKVSALCALSFLLAAPACAAEPSTGPAVRSVNRFALRAATLMEPGKDFFFSPWSAISALGMTYAGARGATAEEMERALSFGEGFHASLGALMQELSTGLDGEDGAPLLASANRVWLREGLALRPKFAQILRRDYGSGAARLDFKGDPEGARRAINRWVEQRTHERIKELLREVDPGTQMVLTNAAYFLGHWEYPFDKGRTQDRPFHVTEAAKRDVPMMQQLRRLDYGEGEEGRLKLLRLPYKGRLSMLLALPAEGGTEDALKALEDGGLLSASLSSHLVDLWLPRFKAEKRYELKALLNTLGVRRAFEDDADFSGMAKDAATGLAESLKISAVIHQTFIEVDEERTEAAAATGIAIVRATAAPRPVPRVQFHADRPFLYFIMDDPTGAILFMGRQGFSD